MDLGPEQVAAWQNGLLEEEPASGTVSDMLTTLRAVLSEAVSLGLVVANVGVLAV